jgi:hypothetical protein
MKIKNCGCEKGVFACQKHAHPETSNASYTPGPWRTHAFDVLAGDQIVAVIGTEEQGGVSFSEATRNAELIAAAPELLLAVKGYAQYLKLDGRESKELAALIAKAEGR